MSELASEHCEACEKGTPPLSEEEAARSPPSVPGVGADGNQNAPARVQVRRTSAMRSASSRARRWSPRRSGHHPDIELGWGRAAFELTTHAASGLTRNDFVMAAKIDQLAER